MLAPSSRRLSFVTSERIPITGVSRGQIVKGKFVEKLDIIDHLGMQQLGVAPAPGQAES